MKIFPYIITSIIGIIKFIFTKREDNIKRKFVDGNTENLKSM